MSWSEFLWWEERATWLAQELERQQRDAERQHRRR
jgi:hypothetical protein